MERGRERGELGMNFKYLWPNLQGIDQHPDFLTAELSCCNDGALSFKSLL